MTDNNTVIWFDSPEQYSEHLSNLPSRYRDMYWYDGFAGDLYNVALNKLIHGDKSYLAAAQKLIDQIGEQQLFALGRPTITTGQVGFMPCVPNGINGQPNDMFNIEQVDDLDLMSPLKIFVETTVSAGLTHKELIARGVAVLAFALAMNTVRPVELYAASFGKVHGSTIRGAIVRIASNPLDLDRAVYMLASPSYCRSLAFPVMQCQQGSTARSTIPFPTDQRELCKCEPHDVLIKGGHLDDTLMLTDPVQWVKTMVAKHSDQGAQL